MLYLVLFRSCSWSWIAVWNQICCFILFACGFVLCSADWIAFLFQSFLILTKTIAVLWCQGIPEVTGTLCILWFTAHFAPWKPQFVSVHFPCFVWVSDASAATPDHDRLWDFQHWWPSLWILGRGCSVIFPSAVLMLQNYKFQELEVSLCWFSPFLQLLMTLWVIQSCCLPVCST